MRCNGPSNAKKTTKVTSTFTIQMFGINEKGETAAIFVPDFKPFFYVKCADSWTDTHAERLLAEFRKRMGFYGGDALISAERVQYHPLYGFSGGKTSQFVRLTFHTLQAMSRVRNFWYTRTDKGERRFSPPVSQGCRLELYESRLPPLLRYFHIHGISPSGWVFVPLSASGGGTTVVPSDEQTTHCQYEYICSCRNLMPQPTKETRVPYKICSFDIEASSSHGDFPLPIKSYKRLATQVVDTYHSYAGTSAKGTINNDEVQLVVEKAIKSAFGFGKCEGVDLVYPKGGLVTRPQLEQCLKRLWSLPCLDRKALKNNNTIESMFEKVIHGQKETYGGGKANEDDGEEDDANEKVYAVDEVYDDEPETLGAKPTCVAPKPIVVAPNTKIHDILTGSGFDVPLTRDEQILAMNDAFQRAKFPLLEGDKVTFIGSTFLRYGESDPYLNHCIVLDTCDPVPGVEIVSVPREIDVLLAWTELIERENPDIIIGYNIFGFDYEFMFRRAQETGCEQEFLRLSRNVDELSAKETTDRETGETTLALDNTKIVLATGEYDLRYPVMRGRLQIDLYTYFRRDFNLASYKLDDVAGEFIRDGIHRVTLSIEATMDADAIPTIEATTDPTTDLHTKNVSGLRAGDYIHIELSGFTSDYYRNGTKFRVLDVIPDVDYPGVHRIRIAGHEHGLLSTEKKLNWCMAKDDVTPQDIFRLSAGSAADRAVVAKYCIQDCNLVHHLTNKIDVLTGYVEMSRICSVPVSFLIFRGQGIKLTSYVAKKCREKNTLMPDLEKSGEMDGYEGAIVLPPKCGMYMDNPVACVDYSSLYPSAMISQNYSHDSKVWTKEYDLEGKLIAVTGARHPRTGKFLYDDLPDYKYIDMEFDTYQYRRNPAKPVHVAPEKVKVGRKICRWAQLPRSQKSIMPAILEELLQARSDTRKQIKKTADPFMQNILDKRQLGYKVTANSLYGQCGSRTSSFYEKDVAASTTATGRSMITYAKNIIENVYGDMEYDTKCHGPVLTKAEYVYGDTDSVFFTFNLEDPVTKQPIRGQKALEMTIEIAQDAAELCTQWLKPPMSLAYEKTLMPFVLLSKKRYVGMLYEEDPHKGKLKYMGISLKRRDSCDYLKDTYGGILTRLMKVDGNGLKTSMEFLHESLQQLVQGTVPMEKLTITRALSGYYKNPQQIAHWVLAERMGKRDAGTKPKPGDRMKFVHVEPPKGTSSKAKLLQGDLIETPEYIQAHGLQIDYTFYISNQLMKPLQQLFGLAVEQLWEQQGKRSKLQSFRREMDDLQRQCKRDHAATVASDPGASTSSGLDIAWMELYMKKKEKTCSALIKNMLFDQYLVQINNRRNNAQTITSFFVPTKK